MSDLHERVEQLFVSTEAALEADESLGRDWIGDNSRLVTYRLLRNLRERVLALLPKRPVAGDRRALEIVLFRLLGRDRFGAQPDHVFASAIADAVDTVRPEPLPLREAWMLEVEEAARNNTGMARAHQVHWAGTPVGQLMLRILAAYRWLEERLDERGDHDGPDGVTAWQRGYQTGRGEERQEVLEILCRYAENKSMPEWAIRLKDAIKEILERGPTRPDSLRELRQEVRQAREENEKLRGVLAALFAAADQVSGMGNDPAYQKARALLEGQP